MFALETSMDQEATVILTTVENLEEAERLAQLLVERRLAACVSFIPQIRSIYRWKGAIEEGNEVQLVIKTLLRNVAEIEALFRTEHGYELPEFLVIPASGGATYRNWIRESVR